MIIVAKAPRNHHRCENQIPCMCEDLNREGTLSQEILASVRGHVTIIAFIEIIDQEDNPCACHCELHKNLQNCLVRCKGKA